MSGTNSRSSRPNLTTISQTLSPPSFIEVVSAELRDRFAVDERLVLVDVATHRLSAAQTIRIHNDYLNGQEAFRLSIQLNDGWPRLAVAYSFCSRGKRRKVSDTSWHRRSRCLRLIHAMSTVRGTASASPLRTPSVRPLEHTSQPRPRGHRHRRRALVHGARRPPHWTSDFLKRLIRPFSISTCERSVWRLMRSTASRIRPRSSCGEATRVWRSTDRASLEKQPSMRLSHEPCLCVNTKVKRPSGRWASQALVSLDLWGVIVENGRDRGLRQVSR
jgi:hypothetical protein